RPITWTPLHAADAYATIARGGVRLLPRLVADEGVAPRVEDLRLAPAPMRNTRKGMRGSVDDPVFRTGSRLTNDRMPRRIFNAPGVTVGGKTGTAGSSPIVWAADGDGPAPATMVRQGDHSWFVVLVADEGEAPRYAIAVVVDYGGSGG